MTDIYPAKVQREALLKFAEALGSRDRALRRDDCGDWRISGKHGLVYAVPGMLDRPETPGFQIVVVGQFSSGRWWGAAKRGLAFAKVTNDGDEEGALFMDRLPTPGEVEAIRHYLGVAKKRFMSEEELARLASVRRPFEKRHGDEAADDLAGAPSRPSAAGWVIHAPAGVWRPLTPSPAWTPR